MCTPVEDTVKVGLTVHYALVVLAVDTVRDICDVALVIAYDLLTAVRANQNHVEDAADRFTAAVIATGAQGNGYEGGGGVNCDSRPDDLMSSTSLNPSAMEAVEEENEDDDEDEDDDKVPATSQPFELCKSLSLQVTITEACLVLLEDPRRESSAAFTMTLRADAVVGLDLWGDGDVADEGQEAVHCSLKGQHLSMLSDTGRWLAARAGPGGCPGGPSFNRNRNRTSSSSSSAPTRSFSTRRLSFCDDKENTPGIFAEDREEMSMAAELCESLSVDVHYTRKTVRGAALASNIAFNVGDLEACLSLLHLSLARSIMLRSTLSGLAPLQSREPDFHCLIGDTRGNASTQVDVFTIVFNVGRLSITAIDDLPLTSMSTAPYLRPKSPTPLVRVQLLSLQLNADGVLNPRVYVSSRTVRYTIDVLNLEGHGCVAVGADFYNPGIAHWEPLIEEWTLTLALSKEDRGISCCVGDDLCPLRLNVSGKFLDVMINKYAEWVRGESEKRAVRPSHHSSSTRPSSNATAALSRGITVAPSTVSALPSSPRSNEGQEPLHVRHDVRASKIGGRGRARTATMCDMNYEECEERDEVSDLFYPTLTPPDSPEESKVHGSHLVLHNRLLCDLYYKAIERDLSASPAPPTRTSTPTPAGQFASYFYSGKISSPLSAGIVFCALPCLALPYLALLHPALSYPALPGPTLSCPALPYPALLSTSYIFHFLPSQSLFLHLQI